MPTAEALQLAMTLGLSGEFFCEFFEHLSAFGTPYTGVGVSQGLYRYRTTEHSKTRTNIRASNEI
jgi:hypothetical protein